MAEQLNLTTPITPPALTHYRVVYLELDWELPRITIGLRGPNGEDKRHSYIDGTALTLMNQLNKLDLSTQSLHRRILARLIADGVLSGSLAGAPD